MRALRTSVLACVAAPFAYWGHVATAVSYHSNLKCQARRTISATSLPLWVWALYPKKSTTSSSSWVGWVSVLSCDGGRDGTGMCYVKLTCFLHHNISNHSVSSSCSSCVPILSVFVSVFILTCVCFCLVRLFVSRVWYTDVQGGEGQGAVKKTDDGRLGFPRDLSMDYGLLLALSY